MKKFLLPILVIVLIAGGVGIAQYKKEKQGAQESDVTAPGSVPSETAPTGSQPVQERENVPRAAEITLTITSPSDGATVTGVTLTVKGKTAARAEVFINDAATVADANGNFSVKITLDEGENPIVVFANDADGNVAEKELTVTYDSGK